MNGMIHLDDSSRSSSSSSLSLIRPVTKKVKCNNDAFNTNRFYTKLSDAESLSSSSSLDDSDSHFSESDNDTCSHDNAENDVRDESGEAIKNKYGTENIGIEDGVEFSSASSIFFSGIAKGSNATPKPTQASRKSATASPVVNPYRKHDSPLLSPKADTPSPIMKNPYSRNNQLSHQNRVASNAAVNPYKTVSGKVSNPYETNTTFSSNVNPYTKDKSSLNGHSLKKDTINNQVSLNTTARTAQPSNENHVHVKKKMSTATSMQNYTTPKPSKPKASSPIAASSNGQYQNSKNTPLIDPALYKPPPFQPKKEPCLYKFTLENRPKHSRQMTPINQLFSVPVSNFWSNFKTFNHMQSELSGVLANTDEHMVVSAPTGAGKTMLFEMAIGRMLSKGISNGNKIVYISPSKALCDERYNDWSRRLAMVDKNLNVAVVTGDAIGYSAFQKAHEAQLILTTPEKWDSITRQWTEHLSLLSAVKLLLVDEIHLIGDESRGGCIEAVICRMKTVQRAALAQSNNMETARNVEQMRMVCVSATLPNITDIASFIDADSAYDFDSSYRPVPLTVHTIGLGYIGKNQYFFEQNLGKEVPGILRRFSGNRPSIVFCHTKKQTQGLATELISSYGCKSPQTEQYSKRTSLPPLRKCLEHGLAYHHAGMEVEDRHLVQSAFKNGVIRCLCATSTLAMGVNLPAHLVVIKGTNVWRGSGNGYQEIDALSLTQMLGRAGRPGFDTSGTAVIMTDKKSKLKFERLASSLEVVESYLLTNFIETLNTEISQRVIMSVAQALDWVKGTFFYIRMLKNPRHYGLMGKSNAERENYLQSLCMKSLEDLHNENLITLSNGGKSIDSRKSGNLMSKHLVPFDAMKLIIGLSHDSGQLQILEMLSETEGLHFPVRKAEKAKLNEAHKLLKHRFEGAPSKIRIQKPSQKAFVLLQCAIGQVYLEDFTLRQEMSLSVDYATRILSAAEDYSREESNNGKVALECMLMRRRLATSLWSDKDGCLNQIGGVGQKASAQLAFVGIRTFDDLMTKSTFEIEQACGRKAPFGQNLKAAAVKILSGRLSMCAKVESLNVSETNPKLKCEISPTALDTESVGGDIVKYTLIAYTDRVNGLLLFVNNISGPCTHQVDTPKSFGRIYVRLVSNIVGLDSFVNIDGNDTLQRSNFNLTPQKTPGTKNSKQTSSTKSKKEQSGKTKSRKKTKTPQPTIEHFSMVQNIPDYRLKKAKTPNNAKSQRLGGIQTQFPPRTHETQQPKKPEPSQTQRSGYFERKAITPPPPITPSTCSQSARGIKQNISSQRYQPSINTQRSPGPSTHQRSTGKANSWQMQIKKQNMLQERAFGSPKENPFASFKFDPNDLESQMEARARETEVEEKSSVLNSIATPISSQPRWRRHSSFGGSSRSIGPLGKIRAVSRPATSSVRETEILRQKATEFNTAYTSRPGQMYNSYDPACEYYNSQGSRSGFTGFNGNGLNHHKRPFSWNQGGVITSHSRDNYSSRDDKAVLHPDRWDSIQGCHQYYQDHGQPIYSQDFCSSQYLSNPRAREFPSHYNEMGNPFQYSDQYAYNEVEETNNFIYPNTNFYHDKENAHYNQDVGQKDSPMEGMVITVQEKIETDRGAAQEEASQSFEDAFF